MRRWKFTAMVTLVAATALAATGCASLGIALNPITRAVAVIRPLQGGEVQGSLSFIQEGKAVRIAGEITGLAPGKHGIHVHEYGDPTYADGSAFGAHLNLRNMPHGGPEDKKKHLGDLGNIEADRTGRAKVNLLSETISLSGRNGIVGRSIIIKERADDYKTQPAGGAGARIAFGIIGMSFLETDN